MQAVARVQTKQARNQRATSRRPLKLGAKLVGTRHETVIHDLSETGILIETEADLATFEQLQLDLPEMGPTLATVMWSSGRFFGCEFHQPLGRAAISAALLRNPIVHRLLAAEDTGTKTEVEEEPDVADDRHPFSVRLRVLLGLTLTLWALILAALWIL